MFTRYNAKEWTITVKGMPISGFAEDFWSFEKDEALADNAVGAQGDVCRSEINNPLYTATVTLQGTSPSVNYLHSLKDETEPFDIWAINKTAGIKEGGAMAMITEVPSSEYGASVGDAAFSFSVYDGQRITE